MQAENQTKGEIMRDRLTEALKAHDVDYADIRIEDKTELQSPVPRTRSGQYRFVPGHRRDRACPV